MEEVIFSACDHYGLLFHGTGLCKDSLKNVNTRIITQIKYFKLFLYLIQQPVVGEIKTFVS